MQRQRHDLGNQMADRPPALLDLGCHTGGGKPKMQAVGACMRKLVTICYGVLKNRKPFDPQWADHRTSGGSPGVPPVGR